MRASVPPEKATGYPCDSHKARQWSDPEHWSSALNHSCVPPAPRELFSPPLPPCTCTCWMWTVSLYPPKRMAGGPRKLDVPWPEPAKIQAAARSPRGNQKINFPFALSSARWILSRVHLTLSVKTYIYALCLVWMTTVALEGGTVTDKLLCHLTSAKWRPVKWCPLFC